MVNEKYSIAMCETLRYLKGINQDDLNKIPSKFIKFLSDNSSKNYECDFDYTKPLKELNISEEARGIIAMICLNYWCITDEQKEKFKRHLTKNELKFQEEIRRKYDPDNLFKNKVERKNAVDTVKIEHKELVEYKEQKWYQKIFNKILYIFRKK